MNRMPSRSREYGKVFLRQIILALISVEADQRDGVCLCELLDGRHKGTCHFGHDFRGGKRFALMFAKEPGNSSQILQTHLDDLEKDSVERFDFERGVAVNSHQTRRSLFCVIRPMSDFRCCQRPVRRS